ncbi:MAG: phasin family protein [Acidimicrobiia bacterium]
MARDDLFRRSFEAGTAFLDMTREKAEALVKDLVKAGEVKKGKASKLIDEVVERSRRSTEELVQIIRREITEQVSALGLATKDDLDALERRLAGGDGGATGPATEVPPVVEAVPGTAAPTPEAPGEPAGGEAQLTGARAAAGAKKAAKARAPRKKAAGSAGPPTSPPAGPPADPPTGG